MNPAYAHRGNAPIRLLPAGSCPLPSGKVQDVALVLFRVAEQVEQARMSAQGKRGQVPSSRTPLEARRLGIGPGTTQPAGRHPIDYRRREPTDPA
jgi:hypothetical protein